MFPGRVVAPGAIDTMEAAGSDGDRQVTDRKGCLGDINPQPIPYRSHRQGPIADLVKPGRGLWGGGPRDAGDRTVEDLLGRLGQPGLDAMGVTVGVEEDQLAD